MFLYHCFATDTSAAAAAASAAPRPRIITSTNQSRPSWSYKHFGAIGYSPSYKDGYFAEQIKSIENNDPTVEKVDYYFDLYKPDHGDNFEIKTLARALINNTNVKTISLFGKKFEGDDIKVFANALEQNTTITAISLRECGINQEGAIVLATALAKKRNLTALDFSNEGRLLDESGLLRVDHSARNSISDAGVAAFAKILEANVALIELNLSDLQTTHAEAATIAEAVETDKNIEEITLSRKHITNLAIAEMLKQNNSLEILKLDHNCFSKDENIAIVKALKDNKTLKELHLGGEIEHTLMKTCIAVLEHNVTLTTLKIPNTSKSCIQNSDSEPLYSTILKFLERNKTLPTIKKGLKVQYPDFPDRVNETIALYVYDVFKSIQAKIKHTFPRMDKLEAFYTQQPQAIKNEFPLFSHWLKAQKASYATEMDAAKNINPSFIEWVYLKELYKLQSTAIQKPVSFATWANKMHAAHAKANEAQSVSSTFEEDLQINHTRSSTLLRNKS